MRKKSNSCNWEWTYWSNCLTIYHKIFSSSLGWLKLFESSELKKILTYVVKYRLAGKHEFNIFLTKLDNSNNLHCSKSLGDGSSPMASICKLLANSAIFVGISCVSSSTMSGGERLEKNLPLSGIGTFMGKDFAIIRVCFS